MAIKFNKNITNNDQTKFEYMLDVYDYAVNNEMYDVCDLMDNLVDDGFNQVYNIVANESDIVCINYDFNANQIPEVAKYISDNIDDIEICVVAAGNYYSEDCCECDDSEDECDCGECCECLDEDTYTTTSDVDTVKSLIGEVCGLIKREINAKSDVEKASVVVDTNSLLDKMINFFK